MKTLYEETIDALEKAVRDAGARSATARMNVCGVLAQLQGVIEKEVVAYETHMKLYNVMAAMVRTDVSPSPPSAPQAGPPYATSSDNRSVGGVDRGLGRGVPVPVVPLVRDFGPPEQVPEQPPFPFGY